MLLRLVLLLPLLAPLPALADAFIAGTEDVPLMPGLMPVPGSSFAFDKPEGRIVEAQAAGKLSRDAVLAFYGASLPQLGWKAAGAKAWRREGETLRLDFRGRDGDLAVGFTLSPN
jgi:hypothetical protein